MSEIKIDDHEFQRRMHSLIEALGDAHFHRVVGDIGQNLVERTKRNIERGRDWQNRKFAENRPVTLARKRGSKPLIDTGSFVANRIFYHVTGRSLILGAGGVQAATLHYGAKKGQFGRTRRGAPIPWGDIPARPYMPVTDDGTNLVPAAREEVLTSITEYLEQASD